jgi:hypothetical protein
LYFQMLLGCTALMRDANASGQVSTPGSLSGVDPILAEHYPTLQYAVSRESMTSSKLLMKNIRTEKD